MDVERQKELEKLSEKGKICGAKKSNGEPCENRPMENGRCRFHGGKASRGVDHYKTNTGKYSKYLPENLRERHEEFRENKDLISLSDEISVLETRISELLEKSRTTQGKVFFEQLLDYWEQFKMARGTDNEHFKEQQLENLLDDIEKDIHIWLEIGKNMDLKRKMIDTERRKMSDLNQYITVDRAMIMFQGLSHIVQRQVQKREGSFMDGEQISSLIQDIGREFNQMFNMEGGGNEF